MFEDNGMMVSIPFWTSTSRSFDTTTIKTHYSRTTILFVRLVAVFLFRTCDVQQSYWKSSKYCFSGYWWTPYFDFHRRRLHCACTKTMNSYSASLLHVWFLRRGLRSTLSTLSQAYQPIKIASLSRYDRTLLCRWRGLRRNPKNWIRFLAGSTSSSLWYRTSLMD